MWLYKVLEAFLRKSWQTTFSEVFLVADSEYFVCQARFLFFNVENPKNKMAATLNIKCA
jgi:hypothetical protein